MDTNEIEESIIDEIEGNIIDGGNDNIEGSNFGEVGISNDISVFGSSDKDDIKIFPPEDENTEWLKLNLDDMVQILYSEIDRKGIAGHHINSMNLFYSNGIRQIITQVFKASVERMKIERSATAEDREIDYVSFNVEFTDVKLREPSMIKYLSRESVVMTPNMARLHSQTYSAPLSINAKITAIAYLKNGTVQKREDAINDFRIAAIPIMLRSNHCHLTTTSTETVREMEEDPLNPGGYFIINGTEWAVDAVENQALNTAHVYRNMHNQEIARLDFISKPGDAYENSFRILLRYLNNGGITLEINTSKHDGLEIPFFVVFRAFGMVRDKDIISSIVYDLDAKDTVTVNMLKILEKAMGVIDEREWGEIKNNTNDTDILLFLSKKLYDYAQKTNFQKDESAVKHMLSTTTSYLDKMIFPHIGLTNKSRIRKMKFLGHLISKLLKVEIGIISSTDRDNYKNKRVHAAGVSLAKSFKTQFNFSIVREIVKELKRAFKSTSFSQVKLAEIVKGAIKPQDLEKVLTRSITTGDSTITVKKTEVTNRVSSQQVNHKNDLNVKSILNTIATFNTSSAKSNARADEMRRVHPSTCGYICPCQSHETGEKVGLVKSMAVSASVSDATNSMVLKRMLIRDPDFILIDMADQEMMTEDITKIFVNGDWIGITKMGVNFAYRYRVLRRHNELDYSVSIVWEESINEIYFWADVGRLLRPLLIVYNNLEEYLAAFRAEMNPNATPEEKKNAHKTVFKQWIKLTPRHITDLRAGKITMDDLREDRVVEYIAPEEQIGCYLSPNISILSEHKNDVLNQYTHCDIDQAILGFIAASSPNGNHTAPIKIAHYTSQKKQTCGWFALNWPYRIDKNTFLQYYCEKPIASTFTDALTYPNGQNIRAAVAIYTGYNQEDSAMLNSCAVDRGLFNGCHYNFEKSELEKGEIVGNIDPAVTMDVKKDAIYEHIEKGLVKPGTRVKKGYVLISKYIKIQKPTDQYLYIDRSVIYKYDEDAIISSVAMARNSEDVEVVKIGFRSYRTIQIGDKMSSRAGNKNICAIKMPSCDMPYDENGIAPDLIFSPFSIPTRMCIGQIMEIIMSEFSIARGTTIDATAFKENDLVGMIDWLRENTDIKFGGHTRLYDGHNGHFIDALIFVGNNYYNRLQKFVADESYSMSDGPTSALTRQPLEGKAFHGGMRIGEMEKDVYASHGTMRAFGEKFYEDSDGIKIPICRICGKRAIVNEKYKIYKCDICRDNADIAMVDSSWVANLLFHEIQAMGIDLKFGLEPYTYAKQM